MARKLIVASCTTLLALLPLSAALFAGVNVPQPSASQLHGGQVMPPTARPHGFSLTDAAAANAQFVSSGNNPAYFPAIPFQQLYYDPTTIGVSGSTITGSNVFHVPTGTMFYVPIGSVDNSPPVLGSFPQTPSEAVSYWSDPSQLGVSQTVAVDGKTISIPTTYLVGPVTTPPLQDGKGTHIITIGVFLTPLNKGNHTVVVTETVAGDLITSPFTAQFTYSVIVQ